MNVGVTVADGFVETKALLVSFKGFIGVVVVEAPQSVMPGKGDALVDNPEAVVDSGFAVLRGFDEFELVVLEFEL